MVARDAALEVYLTTRHRDLMVSHVALIVPLASSPTSSQRLETRRRQDRGQSRSSRQEAERYRWDRLSVELRHCRRRLVIYAEEHGSIVTHWTDTTNQHQGLEREVSVSVIIPTLGRRSLLLSVVTFYGTQSSIHEIIIADGSNRKLGMLERTLRVHPKVKYIRLPRGPKESVYQHLSRRIATAAAVAVSEYVIVSGDDDVFLPSGIRRAVNVLNERRHVSVVIGAKIFWRHLGSSGRKTALHPTLDSQLPHVDAPSSTAVERLLDIAAPPWRCWSVGRRSEVQKYWFSIAPVIPRGLHLAEALLHASARLRLPVEVIQYPMIMRRVRHPHTLALKDYMPTSGSAARVELAVFLRSVTEYLPAVVAEQIDQALRELSERAIVKDTCLGLREMLQREALVTAESLWYELPFGLWNLNARLGMPSVSRRSRYERCAAILALYDESEAEELRRDFSEFGRHLGSLS